MRRQDREVTDLKEIYNIIRKCDVCRLAFYNDNYPYIIPMNFGVTFDGEGYKLYFHAAKEGTKLELLQKNPRVAFEMDCDHNLVMHGDSGSCTMEYESVCGNGELRIVEDGEKNFGLSVLMEQYHGKKEFQFPEEVVRVTTVLELTVNEITGKRRKKKTQPSE
jgi:nitroimidazol reductase NimA-like FMN-containing flavoprotein (pyridoxamine 5'-phosphate oxidase superfamily)